MTGMCTKVYTLCFFASRVPKLKVCTNMTSDL